MEIKFINTDDFSRDEKDLMLKSMEEYKDEAYNYGMIDLNCTKKEALDKHYEISKLNETIEYNDSLLNKIYNRILKKEKKLEYYENRLDETNYIEVYTYCNVMIRILERKLNKLYNDLDEGKKVQYENISYLKSLQNKYRYICNNFSHKRFITYVEEELKKELKK